MDETDSLHSCIVLNKVGLRFFCKTNKLISKLIANRLHPKITTTNMRFMSKMSKMDYKYVNEWVCINSPVDVNS